MKPNHYPPKLNRHLAAALSRTFTRRELAVINAESGKLLRKGVSKHKYPFTQCVRSALPLLLDLLKKHSIHESHLEHLLEAIQRAYLVVKAHELEWEQRAEEFQPRLLNRIQQKTDIVALVQQSLPLVKNGANWFCNCPFHSEKSPSFSVSPLRQHYYCFGCGANGDVFNWLVNYKRVTFRHAVKYLAKRAGVRI